MSETCIGVMVLAAKHAGFFFYFWRHGIFSVCYMAVHFSVLFY